MRGISIPREKVVAQPRGALHSFYSGHLSFAIALHSVSLHNSIVRGLSLLCSSVLRRSVLLANSDVGFIKRSPNERVMERNGVKRNYVGERNQHSVAS